METDQEQLRKALKIARSAYWEYDVVNDTFLFNDQFYSILRTSAEKEGGYAMSSARYAERFVHPDDLAVVGVEIQKALASPDPHYSAEIDHRIIYGDRTVGSFTVHIRVVKDEGGATVRTYRVNVDVTNSSAPRTSLTTPVSLLQSTFDSTSEGMLVVDRAGRIVSFNKRFVALWRIPQEVIDEGDDEVALGHVLGQLEAPDKFMQKVRDLYADPEAESSDVLDFKDGRVFERYSRPQLLDGHPIGRIWSFRDITERMGLEAQLRQSQKMEAFGQLAAGIAHDFNNILTVIQGNASLMGMVDLGRGEQRAAVSEILTAAERAANLTRQLLTFSRLRRLQTKDLDLNEVVANLAKMLQRLLGEDIAQETHCAPGGAFIHADMGMIEQVLVNLAVNSRDAMPKGGRLILRTEALTLDRRQAGRNPNARAGSSCAWPSPTRARGSPRATCRTFSSPSSRRRTSGRGRASGSPRCTALSSSTTAGSRWRAASASGRPSASTCRA